MTATKKLAERVEKNRFCENPKCRVTIWKPGEMLQPGRKLCRKCEQEEMVRRAADRRMNEERAAYLNSFLQPEGRVEYIDNTFVIALKFREVKPLLDAAFKLLPPEDYERVKERLLSQKDDG